MTRIVYLLVAFLVVGASWTLSAESVGLEEGEAQEEALRVNINSASAVELEQLPGIGETVAKRIMEHREKNGAFQKTEELMNVRGIGEKTYMKLRPFLTVGPPQKKK